jgi:hypothetical protein
LVNSDVAASTTDHQEREISLCKLFVDRHIDDCDLSVVSIAAAFCMSTQHPQKALEVGVRRVQRIYLPGPVVTGCRKPAEARTAIGVHRASGACPRICQHEPLLEGVRRRFDTILSSRLSRGAKVRAQDRMPADFIEGTSGGTTSGSSIKGRNWSAA